MHRYSGGHSSHNAVGYIKEPEPLWLNKTFQPHKVILDIIDTVKIQPWPRCQDTA